MDTIDVHSGEFTDDQIATLVGQTAVRIRTASGLVYLAVPESDPAVRDEEWLGDLAADLKTIEPGSACRL